jgi:hypothetical protein
MTENQREDSKKTAETVEMPPRTPRTSEPESFGGV